MELKILDDYATLSAAAADIIYDTVIRKPDALLCFATGDTPRLTYQLLVERLQKEKPDLSKVFFIGLDEWVGIPPGNTGSCDYFLKEYLFHPLDIPVSNYHLFDALYTDEKTECDRMNRLIASHGGIDLALVGVGMNGHIGFNEPGTDLHSLAHAADLDETTRTVGQKYFNGPVAIRKGITVGLGQLMEARTLLMLANGEKKAPVIRKALKEEISSGFPASLMQKHSNSILMIDRQAAAGLQTITH